MKSSETGTLSKRLKTNIDQLNGLLGGSSDVVIKELQIEENTNISLIYIDGLVDTQVLHNSILYSLQEHIPYEQLGKLEPEQKIEIIKKQILIAGDLTVIVDYSQFVHELLSGSVMLLLDGTSTTLRIGLPGWEDRNVGEPSSQSVVRGPMEGFTENLRTNTALVRRKIKDSHLWLETVQIGRVTQTSVSIMYLSNIANKELVQEVKRRLNKIDTDSILEWIY